MKEIPKKLIVIGGGVIGLELGSVYQRLGSHVEVIEFAEKILAPFDNEVSTEFLKILKKQKINFHLGTKVVGGSVNGDLVKLIVEDVKVFIYLIFIKKINSFMNLNQYLLCFRLEPRTKSLLITF